MTGFTFALLSMFGVPAAVMALIFLAHRLTPAAVWKTLPVQVLATLAFLSCIGLPVLKCIPLSGRRHKTESDSLP